MPRAVTTGWLKQQNLFSHSTGAQKSKIKAPARLCPLQGLQAFQVLVASGIPRLAAASP